MSAGRSKRSEIWRLLCSLIPTTKSNPETFIDKGQWNIIKLSRSALTIARLCLPLCEVGWGLFNQSIGLFGGGQDGTDDVSTLVEK